MFLIRTRIVSLNKDVSVMVKQVCFILCLLAGFPFPVLAQTGEREVVQGVITVPEGDEAQGITVYNEASGKGTLTNREGEFEIAVALNDSLTFTGVQFQEFTVIINEGVIENKELHVLISETVTELPEVVVSPDRLTGNVRVDVARIEVADPDLPRISAAELAETDYIYVPDSLTQPGKNDAMWQSQTLVVDMLNFVNIFKAVAGTAEGREQRRLPDPEIDDKIRKMYDDHFFQENLNLEMQNINDFIFYAHENGLNEEMLEEGNEIELVKFLIEQSEKYKEERNEN